MWQTICTTSMQNLYCETGRWQQIKQGQEMDLNFVSSVFHHTIIHYFDPDYRTALKYIKISGCDVTKCEEVQKILIVLQSNVKAILDYSFLLL